MAIKALAFCLLIGIVVTDVVPTFVRATLSSSSNACINNLRLIDSAKDQWALEQNAPKSAAPTFADLQTYLGHGSQGELPKCPEGGKYTLGRMDQEPTCSLADEAWPNEHRLAGTDSDSWWFNFKHAYIALFSGRVWREWRVLH